MAFPPTIPIFGWAWDDLLFLLLAGIMLAAAVFVVIGRDIVRSGLSMILAFAALAGIYVLAGAVVVAAAQVLIYIGAISVLILFAIMLTQTKAGPAELVFHRQSWAGALAAFGLAFLLLTAIINTVWPLRVGERLWSSTTDIAMLLFADSLYVLALQVIAVMLTAAVVGGVFLAKREDAPDPGERSRPELDRLRRPPETERS
ncbi:MAG TPA: NADH-quinone oxidoreductase subunit J [Candidatus Limnocylindria bacterium]|nr:NADH-quinone oxidoreductase subunit J [Candidatus Limnocylindria bacterium]